MTEFNLSEKRQKLRKDLDYLFSKINWGDSFLDANAARIMNEFWKDLIESDKEFIKRLKENICQSFNAGEVANEIDKLAGGNYAQG